MPTGKEMALGFAASALALVAGLHLPLAVLAGLNVIDLVSGVLKGGITGSLDSGQCRNGALRKLMQWLVVGTAFLVDRLIGQGDYAATVTITTFCTTEVVSILENAALAGLPIPPMLRQGLAKLQGLALPLPPTGLL